MFFLLSKLFWLLAAPSHLIAWLSIASAILLFSGKGRAARWTSLACAILFVAFGFLPLGAWLLQRHEDLYARPAYPAQVDGILILGGGNDPDIVLGRNALTVDPALSRQVAASVLARRYPTARIVFTGGSGDPRRQNVSESTSAFRILTALGVSPARLILEKKSRNTWENFVFTKALVKPKPGETWLLATSAFHMPRAMAIAKRVGWPIEPWPTDYMTAKKIRFAPEDLILNLEKTDTVFREYAGILVYRLSGKAG